MIFRERFLKQPTAGAVSWNVGYIKGTIGQVSINPSATGTTYNFTLTDDVGNVVYIKKGKKGTYVDDSKVEGYGIYTANIASASASNRTWITTLIWNDSL